MYSKTKTSMFILLKVHELQVSGRCTAAAFSTVAYVVCENPGPGGTAEGGGAVFWNLFACRACSRRSIIGVALISIDKVAHETTRLAEKVLGGYTNSVKLNMPL